MLKRMPFKQYLILLAKGLFVMLLMLTWSLQQVAGRWIMPVTPITIWTFFELVALLSKFAGKIF